MDSGDKVEMAVALDELLEAREQSAREPLLAQIAALTDASLGVLALLNCMALGGPTADKLGFALADTVAAARAHDEAIKRAAFEAGARAQRQLDLTACADMERWREIAAHLEEAGIVSPPAQETG
jgi:hypothetical protein